MCAGGRDKIPGREDMTEGQGQEPKRELYSIQLRNLYDKISCGILTYIYNFTILKTWKKSRQSTMALSVMWKT